jgi:integrase
MHRNATRHGAAVIARKAKNGTVTFSIKFVGADGVLAWERLGSDVEGWSRPKAKAVLEARLVDVRREGLTRPSPITFAEFAREWATLYPTTKALKRSTASSYRTIVENHLIPAVGDLRIADLDIGAVDRYVADRLADGCAPTSVNRHLNVLSLIVRAARKRGLLRANPVELVDRPRERRRRWRILSPVEIRRVQIAFAQLVADADDPEERLWIEQAGTAFVVIYGTGLRRGELLGLRWRHVRLADPEGPTIRVEETFVRNRTETPKSVTSARTIAVGRIVADVLFEHRARSRYVTDDDRVFCHPQTGGPLDHKRYADTFRAALAKAEVEGEVRPFHDGRHTSITNAAAAGVSPGALQARAGHSDLGTTQRYIDLAGVRFREEAEVAEARMFGVMADLGSADG